VWWALNSNLAILFLGSVVGFVFVHLVWEPMQSRRAANEKREAIRDEVEYLLYQYQRQFEELTRNPVRQSTGGVRSLDPTYSSGWTLEGLVYAGWGRAVLQGCRAVIEHVESESTEVATRIEARNELDKKLFGKRR
jgi:uncharacterized membrane protein YccC